MFELWFPVPLSLQDFVTTLPECLDENGESEVSDLPVRFAFPNGFGASVIREFSGVGESLELFEIAVLNRRGDLEYCTDVTDDVLRYLTSAAVVLNLWKISRLDRRGRYIR